VGDGLIDQFIGGFAVGDGVAIAFEEDEVAFSGAELFVAGHVGEDAFGFDLVVEDKGEIEVLKEVEEAFGMRRIEAGELLGEKKSGAYAEGDRFAVEELSVGDGSLDGVADGVAEVEKGARSRGLVFVFFHDAGFDRDVSSEEIGVGCLIARVECFEGVEHGRVADGSMLDDFGITFAVNPVGKGGEGVGVDDDEAGLMEGPHEVLSFRSVDPSFSSDRRIDLGDDGGGNLDDRDAAVEDGGDKAGEVSHDASAKGDDEGFAIVVVLDEGAAEVIHVIHRLRAFSWRNEVASDGESGLAEGSEDLFGIVEGDIGIGDDSGVLTEIGIACKGSNLGKNSRLDEDVVGTGAEIDRDSGHGDGGNELKEGEKSCQSCMRRA